MAVFVWDCFLCFLPSLLLFLLCLALRWPRAGCWTRLTVRAAEPRFICKPTALAKYLLRHCGSLAKPRLAPWPRGDPHLQTLSSLLWGQHGDTIQFSRDNLLLRDGGIVAVDWALGYFTSTPPVLLLIPQSWGGMTPHLKALCHQAVRQGFYVVVFHPRGTAGCPLTTARLTEFGDPADLEQAVAYIHSRHPSSVLVAVSEGSGSGILLSYLGEAVLDVDRALGSSSLRDFEERLFCSSAQFQQRSSRPPANPGLSSGPHSPQGLAPSVAWALGERAYPAKDWDSYWERNEPLRDADEVAVPVLCICSRDDPLLPPASTLPIPLFQSNPYFLLVLTDKGGHCGFTMEGREEMEGARTENDEPPGLPHLLRPSLPGSREPG
uniref:Abhydrolase domain containing 15 n=1 Tax=Seriola lalandi dorsalis TaxID=1841481 RepID=A0A3B4YAN3_SERLL